MNDRDLDRIVRASRLQYFAPGELILTPAAERPSNCYVIRRGAVHDERPGRSNAAPARWEQSTGEMFPKARSNPGLFMRASAHNAKSCLDWGVWISVT